MSASRPHLQVLQGGAEAPSASRSDLAVILGTKPSVEYAPTPEPSQCVANALWPLTPQMLHQKMDIMTEEEERRAAGAPDELSPQEHFYRQGEQ